MIDRFERGKRKDQKFSFGFVKIKMFIENLREDREEGVGLVNLEFKKEVKF